MIANPYIQDILAQPAAVEACVGRYLAERPVPAELGRRLRAGEFDRVILTGMGSSLYGEIPAALALLAAGLPVMHLDASELIHFYPAAITPHSLAIVVSQSGRSAEIVRLLDMIPEGATVLAVSNTSESPLAQRAGYRVWMGAGDEFSVATKTYACTLAALRLVALDLPGEPVQPAATDLRTAALAMRRALDGWREQADALRATLGQVRAVSLVGRGDSLASALTGALIVKEASKVPAEGLSAGQFRHGPLEVCGPGLGVVVFEGSGEAAGLNARLAGDVLAAGSPLVWVSRTGGLDPGGLRFALPDAAVETLPLLEILAAQLLAIALAEAGGREPGVFQRGSKVTERE